MWTRIKWWFQGYFPNFSPLKRFPLLEWIWLYFYIKKQPGPFVNVWDYSGELQDAVSIPFGYGFNSNQVVAKLLGLVLTNIEAFHRYRADKSTGELPEFLLDWASYRNREQIPREYDEEVSYFVLVDETPTGGGYTMRAGPLTSEQADEAIKLLQEEAKKRLRFTRFLKVSRGIKVDTYVEARSLVES